MTWSLGTHLGYLLLALPLTVWVASTLARNGAVFLADVFADDGALAGAVNRLLVVGFYLISVGFVLLYLRAGGPVSDLDGLLEAVSVKVGLVMLVTGVLHVGNVLVFNAIRRRSHDDARRRAYAPYAPVGGPVAGYPAPPAPQPRPYAPPSER